MGSYILVGRNYDDKQWWNDLIRACAVIGDPFEIHCWFDKMTPFFSIFFGGKLYSEHYGTEVTISKVIREKEPAVDRILDRMSDVGVVYRNI